MDRIDTLAQELQEYCIIRKDEPLSGYTTFKTGGPAELFIIPKSSGVVPEITGMIRESAVPLTVIGGGSNLLASDSGVRGAVLAIREDPGFMGRISMESDGCLYADASVAKERFIEFTLANGLCGMEFMAGIPGCIGGGIAMNAGTDKGWFSDIVKRLDLIGADGKTNAIQLTRDMSSYRSLNLPAGSVITGGHFSLEKARDIGSVAENIKRIIAERWAKHPLSYPSAGSVFKNPAGHSSWKLIDECGLKGFTIGGVQASELHTNFIINADNATSGDIYALIEHVREAVYARSGIRIETEIRMIGDF